jgi:hypothetical protein
MSGGDGAETMETRTHYWTLIRLDSAGGWRSLELPGVREFFERTIAPSLERDGDIQKQLMDWLQWS